MGTLALVLQLGKLEKLLHSEELQNQPVDRTGLESPVWGVWEAEFSLTLLAMRLPANPQSRSHSQH